jgi:CysZ protein
MNGYQRMSNQILNQHSGAHYFIRGWQLATLPGLRAFVILPLLINLILFSGAFIWLFSALGGWLDTLMSYLPNGLSWLEWLLWPVAILGILLAFSFIFSMVGNLIASPFNGFLAEKVELYLTNQPLDNASFSELIKDVPRIIGRELSKLGYWLPKAIGLLLLFLIPAIGQTIAPLLWFLFTAWMMVIQYVDYPFDNHKVPFTQMRDALKQHRGRNLTFGALVSLATSLPLVNLIIMPIAVCGATAIWVDHYRDRP